MIVLKENERLYPATWEYNAARVMTRLAIVIENNGGRVKYGHSAVISNRTLSGAIIEKEQRIKKLKELNAETQKETRAAAIKALEKELDKLKQINNDARTVTHTSYISFIFENNYYYFQIDRNPFFEFYYIKTPINNGQYSKDACLMESKKDWLFDCFFSWDCNDAEIKEGANLIFNMLCAAPFSTISRDSTRRRVNNTYNSGFHYETVYAPERLTNIDF